MALSVVSSTLKMLRAVLAAGSHGFVTATPSPPSSEAVEEDLQRLGRTLERIQAVLADALERQIADEGVRLWLREIGDLARDAQGLLDEVEFAELQRRVDEAAIRGKGDRPAGDQNDDPSLRGRELVGRIRDIRARSDDIETDRNRLRLGEEDGAVRRVSRAPPRPPAAAHVDRSSCSIIGRGCDVEKVVDMLLLPPSTDPEEDEDDEDDPISVVVIHGDDGIGKTTLAQLVFGDRRVESHYDMKLWASASAPGFDVTRLTREIVESATEESCDLDELNSLQEILDDHLAGKRVLLVLDDVQDVSQNYWEALLVSLHRSASGSRVLITTPSAEVARSCGSPVSQRHPLQGLAEEDSWSLFCHYAFGGQLPHTAHPRIVETGKEICRRCEGSPLTLITTAELLRGRSTDERCWEEILLASDTGELLSSILQVGYHHHHLPSHLKQCLAYSAVLPRGCKFGKDQLVRLWVAQGFVRPTERKLEEEIAGEYFEDLHRKSFFRRKSDYRGTTRSFVMSDRIQNLAQSLWWEGDCFRGEEPPGCKISRFHCHSTVVFDSLAALSPCDAAYDPRALRTLILRWCGRLPDRTTALLRPPLLDALFQKLRYLRVLDLSDNSISELPPSVGDLKFLRYLGLNKTRVTRLPEEIGGLCCLQTLELRHCYCLAELPGSVRYLLSLRHLDLHCSFNLSKMPLGIGDLTSLQTLPLFAVGREEGSAVDHEELIGGPAGIAELRHLNGLRGELHILGLQNAVYGKIDAGRAKMASKEHLERLHLDWKGNDSFAPDLAAVRDQDLLDSLQPHANLRELKISMYRGRSFPSWMGNGAFAMLRRVALIGCGQCSTVSPLGRLPALRSLDVRNMDRTRSVGREFFCGGGGGVSGGELLFPSLEELGLHSMGGWEVWVCWAEEGGSDFPCLRQLTLRSCPKLRSLSLHNLKALRSLDIEDCEELAWISCFGDSGTSSSGGLQGGGQHSCLVKLELKDCPKLGASPSEQPPCAHSRLHAGSWCESLQRKRARAEAP